MYENVPASEERREPSWPILTTILLGWFSLSDISTTEQEVGCYGHDNICKGPSFAGLFKALYC